MHFNLVVAAFVGLFALMPAAADASCCDQAGHASHQAACCDKPCCNAAKDANLVAPMTVDPQLAPTPPIRQTAVVWFHRPVLVGRSILQGRYVIEHDNARAARGEPCTHLYAYDNRKTPVATFHCTHLERERAAENVVVLTSVLGGSMQQLTEFQFAGETASHGYPSVR